MRIQARICVVLLAVLLAGGGVIFLDALARHLIDRAVWLANSTEEAVRDGGPLPWNPNIFNQNGQ